MILKTKSVTNQAIKMIQLRKEKAVTARIELQIVLPVLPKKLELQSEGSTLRVAASAPDASQRTHRIPTQISSTKTREVKAPLRVNSTAINGTIVTIVMTATARAREANVISML